MGCVRQDFGFEYAVSKGCQRSFVAAGSELILLFPADLPALGDFFGGDAHTVSDAEVFLTLKNAWIHGNFMT